ncbi:MAG TPA: glycosyltransferase family 39 protein [Ktedonobacterales bacterium]
MSAADTQSPYKPRLTVPARYRQRLGALLRRHGWSGGLAILIGSLLRLLWLNDTSFLGDQAQLLAVGRSAAYHQSMIITGIPSSIGSLNPPAATWLYGPFALVGGPLGATLFTALANIFAVALLYALATRYVSRRAGFAAALLYATASGPTHYSRFIWQQNLLAPVLLLFFWVLLRAVIERRRGWLGWSALLWALATELHPTAAPLLGLIAVVLLLTWRDVRPRDLAWAAGALALLFGATAIWEIVSNGADLHSVQRFSQGRAIIDTWAITYLLNLISPAPASWLGASTLYTRIGQALSALNPLMTTLVAAAQVWLIGALVWPWARPGRTPQTTRAALAETRWRFALCLALWEALPLALMLRHTRAVQPHYLLVLLPAVYLCMGAFLADVSIWTQRLLARRWLTARRAQWATTLTLGFLLVALAAAQTVGVVGELATIHAGAFDGLALPLHYGTPLSSELNALQATQATARRLHATVAIASTRVEQEPLGYLNATDGSYAAATDYISDGCVALPDAKAYAPLVTLAIPSTSAALLLPHVAGAQLAQHVDVQGGAPYQVYVIAPGATLAGEQAISASVTDTQPQPVAYAYTTQPNGRIALAVHWQGAPQRLDALRGRVTYWDGADPKSTPIGAYTFTAQALDAQGQPIGAPITTLCDRFGWSYQLGLLTTTRLPSPLVASGRIAGWRLSARMALEVATRPRLGPLTLENADFTTGPPQPLGPGVSFTAPQP